MTLIAKTYQSLATAYHPTPPVEMAKNDAQRKEFLMEGGDLDRKGFPLRCMADTSAGRRELGFTLENFIFGKAPFVACAMEGEGGPRYGTALRIPELERELNGGKPINFVVVDTGGAFKGKGRSRIDICCNTDKWGCEHIGNMKPVTLVFLEDE